MAVALWELPVPAENFVFVQTSDPPGLVSLTTTNDGGTSVSTVFATQLTNGYRLALWQINGAEQRDALGHALNPAQFAIVEPTAATAIYRHATADSNTNGIPDWWELYNQPDLVTNASDDAEGDGFSVLEEYRRDYQPNIFDEIRSGGISMSASPPTLVLFDTNFVSFDAGSCPPGLVPMQSGVTNRNAALVLNDAFGETNGYRFAYWIVNEQIQTDLVGQAASSLALQLASNTLAQAVFLTRGMDSDSDTVPDWYEYYCNLTLDQIANDDADGDGFDLLEEYRRDYCAVLSDGISPGGISLAFSASTLVIANTNFASYVIGSTPANLVPSATGITNVGVQLVTADAFGLTGGYRFACWTLNDNIQTDALGRAVGRVACVLSSNTQANALFVAASDDANTNSVADWWEYHFLGRLVQGVEADSDGDGFSIREEYVRDYHPGLPDWIEGGGISLCFSSPATVIANTNLVSVSVESQPPGLISGLNAVTNLGATILLPDSFGATNGCRFAYWLLNGAILSDGVGRAIGGVSMPLEGNTVARAVFVSETADQNSNRIPDWFEYHFLGELADSATADGDGDGLDLLEEYWRDYHPCLSDQIRSGGISMAFAQPASVGFGFFRRAAFALLDGVATNFFGALGSTLGAFQVPGCSYPALGDWNNDGVLDLFVGGSNGVLRVFENAGSPLVPNLVERSDSFSMLSALWAGVTNPAPALGDWTGDGEADLAMGGDISRVVLVSSSGSFEDPEQPAITNSLNLATSRAVPALAYVDGDHYADLFVLLADGTVSLYLNTGNVLAPFTTGTVQSNVLNMAVSGATGIAAGDVDGDGRTDVLLSDAMGRIWEFQGAAGGTYSLVSRVFAGSYDGFAQQLTIAAGDFSGDGSIDVIGGSGSGGLVYLKNPAQHLLVNPPSVTLLNSRSASFSAINTTNTVTWSLLRSPSGGSIDPSNGLYIAGAGTGVDFVEAAASDGMSGRAYVNVISTNDVAGFGKAITVGGGRDLADPVWQATDYIANRTYNALRYKGYARENIRYWSFNPGRDVDGDGLDNDIAGFSSFANVAGAFTNWVGNANRLVVCLVDHGSATSDGGYFRLNGGENLTSTQLNAWLTAIQDRHGTEVVVVLDFCYAGRFLQDLAYAGPAKRVVIAATSPGELTYFLSGGMVSFSDLFLSGLLQGLDLQQAFVFAQQGMQGYQNPTLDDDGDGVYRAGVDGAVAACIPIGATCLVGKDVPVIGSVAGSQTLDVGTTATLWADGIESYYPIDRVYCAIVPPSFSANTNSGVPVTAMSEVTLSAQPGGRYQADVDRFSEPGVYRINYYARDIWGSVSPPKQGLVTQAGYDERMAIVTGGATNDAGWAAIVHMASTAYQTALARRLDKTRVRYLSVAADCDLDGDGSNDVAAASSGAALSEAITNWAAGANKLTLCLLSTTTSNGQYRLNPGETLSASQLDGWLDAYQATNASAMVVMDFDGSGGYLASLAPPVGRERILIASTKAGAASVRSVGGLISFSQFFLNGIFYGKSLGAAFSAARDAIKNASGRVKQTAQLDDSGDGVPDQKNVDGLVAATRYLGAAFATGADAPFIGTAMPDQTMTVGTSMMLWVANVLSGTSISNVWCAVTAPDYDGSGDPPQVDLPWSPANGRYEAVCTNFTLPGTYACTFFALDNTGALSAPVQSLLIAGDAYEPDGTNALATIFPTEEVQLHSIHVSGDEDWVLFYAPTGFAFNIDATQLGTNSDLVLEVYYELPDGSLESVYGEPENGYGTGSNVTERIVLDLKANLFNLEPGIYFVRVGSADTNLFGPGSDYALEIYEPVGGGGGVTLLSYPGPLFRFGTFVVSLSPSNVAAAGAAWRVQEQGGTWRSDNRLYSLPVPDSGDWHIEFRDAAGFTAPADQALSLQANRTVTNSAAYAPVVTYTTLLSRAVGMALDPAGGGVFSLTCPGYPGQYCAFEESTNLLQWVPVATNTVPEDGTLRSYITNNPARPRLFYRWHRIE